MIICAVKEITKTMGGNRVFDDITLDIHEKDRVGLVGRNGSGKTTLFNCLAKVEPVDKGDIFIKKDCTVGYLEQIPGYSSETTVKEVLYSPFQQLIEMEKKMRYFEGEMAKPQTEKELESIMTKYAHLQEQFALQEGYEMEATVQKVVKGLKVDEFMSRSFALLSGGEKTKVCLAKTLLEKPGILLLDEPTNHLDMQSIEWLEQFIQDYDGAIVVISHDRFFLDKISNRIIEMEDGCLHSYKTNYSGYVKEKEERLLAEFAAYKEQQKKIKKIKEAIKRLRQWANEATPPNADLFKRAKSMEKALERMEKLKKPKMENKTMGLKFNEGKRTSNDLVVVKELSKSFHGKEVFSGVNMHIRHGERVALIGQNGAGKSTLLKLLMNQLEPDSGEMKLGNHLNIGYLSQEFKAINENNTVVDEFREKVFVNEGEARGILATFMFYGPDVFKKVKSLSGGEKMRLKLAQFMHENINFLILDEPTNHLDIDSREVLEDALEKFTGTVLAISHDRYFLEKLFNQTYWLESGRLHYFPGSYQWAKEKVQTVLK
ncbi:ABC-F type ribosomal protection protein [Bacillus carboniphilus]|uniref:ABC-F type ribosomal protection protein n=1 Tax=Bacillus carboniphilus TaxID=86663 RepID=A0ABY9JQ37_9BACI|nr:ABC-F type ribosomal protection protein [Bacillus carboniphilus]WLR41515.1 ABC-F type ribosomal protection protein [Bacillus carboniphilus]